ncbi:MAG: hypothetical protein ACRBN8_32105 [Nannocystales bacterium]
MGNKRLVLASAAVTLAVSACTVSPGPREDFPETTATPTTASGTSNGGVTGSEAGELTSVGSDSSGGEKLDVNAPDAPVGCEMVDFLFVIDNSLSMQTYQEQLAEEFPNFIAAAFEALPPDVDVHVGITTTDFDYSCGAPEVTGNCQTTASFEEVNSHYITPDVMNNGGNGSQGRLFEWSDQHWFETNSGDDPAALTQWFSGAAVAAGEQGCSFEMPVAAAGWATDPINAETNEGFIRDENALLVVFFLTDEPDKSPEPESVHAAQMLAAKEACGGEECIFVSGLIPDCIEGANQKLWQFMTLFDEGNPPWGDVAQTTQYSQLFGGFLAGAVADACLSIPAA